ncbi:Spondin-2, variant 2 [Homalodisca vitripennis]|nr:Spondin-2, variant 2 [Homalodisca vitripennis]
MTFFMAIEEFTLRTHFFCASTDVNWQFAHCQGELDACGTSGAITEGQVWAQTEETQVGACRRLPTGPGAVTNSWLTGGATTWFISDPLTYCRKSHSRSYSLFRLGQKASPGVKAFSEIGRGDLLEAPGPGVFDEFVAPAIPTGAGRTEAQFFVDGNHSRVSLMSRIIPSPDWFIGIDSFNLCVDGNWLDTITIEAINLSHVPSEEGKISSKPVSPIKAVSEFDIPVQSREVVTRVARVVGLIHEECGPEHDWTTRFRGKSEPDHIRESRIDFCGRQNIRALDVRSKVDPLDAGTDNGFTFTAPNWATSPQGVIYRITSRYPSHPAGSFYYPYLKRLPPIATFQFIKTREYELNEVFHHSEDDKRYDLVNLDQSNTISVINSNNDIQLEMEAERREQEMRLQQQLATKSTIARTNALIRHARKNRRRGLRRRQR